MQRYDKGSIHQLMPGITATIEEVNAPLAQKYLTFNRSNRPMVDSRVQKYAEAMRRGEWQFEGTPFIFTERGDLIQGQHRAAAVIRAGASILVLVLRGLPQSVFRVIDTGKPRSGGDTLHVLGMANSTAIAAAIRFVLNYESGDRLLNRVYTNDEIANAAELWPTIGASIAHARKVSGVLRNGGAAAGLHYLFSKRDTPMADAFFEALGTGDSLAKNDPILVLRNRLLQLGKARLPLATVTAITIKAWNAHRRGQTASLFKWLDEEPMPVIE